MSDTLQMLISVETLISVALAVLHAFAVAVAVSARPMLSGWLRNSQNRATFQHATVASSNDHSFLVSLVMISTCGLHLARAAATLQCGRDDTINPYECGDDGAVAAVLCLDNAAVTCLSRQAHPSLFLYIEYL
eukprot:scaffold205376_cov56-Prasinocladus_malaysianus.AAC.1